MPILRLALGQTNPRVGDFSGNSAAILAHVRRAFDAGADLIAFAEMSLSGYPIEDLATRPGFLRAARAALDALATEIATAGAGCVPVIVGFPHGPLVHDEVGSHTPTAISHNSAAVLLGGAVVAIYNKHHLPNYSVFDEYRNFRPGVESLIMHLADTDVALAICEDIWQTGDPLASLEKFHPGLLLVLNGSPFERKKEDLRLPLVRRRALELDAPIAYLNLVGGQDDLVFDGDSFIIDASGQILARSPQFVEDLLITDVDVAQSHTRGEQPGHGVVVIAAGSGHPTRATRTRLAEVELSRTEDDRIHVWNALVLGLRDYVTKNGFPSVILGLSGGIDSAVCAVLAVDALGPERVYGVSMPSVHSSDHSRSDALDVAQRLGIHLRTESIANLVSPVEKQLSLAGVAAENLQARLRGIILMSLSNSEGHLVLTTGNKTEIAVGYSTIYGDSVGGFAPIRDVPKTLVWELARWRNEWAQLRGETPPIPENSIAKPASAELRPGQLDQDSLPDYDVLDAILELYIGRQQGREEIITTGYDADLVDHIISLIDRAEWKRRQGAIGPKISDVAFGRDRRLPVTYTRDESLHRPA